MNKIFFPKMLLCFLSLAFLFCACSGDDEDPGNNGGKDNTPYKVTYKVSSLRSADVNATAEEMMKSILLIIVKSDGTIENIENVNLPVTQEEYVIEMLLTQGSKSVYGFANLTDNMKTQAGLSSLLVGSTMPDLSEAALTIQNGYTIDESNNEYLPMSNYTGITVSAVNGQSFSLELIRLVSKVRLRFTNESGESIILGQLTITPLTTSSVYLLPRNVNEPVFPATYSQGDFSSNFGAGYAFADGEQLEYITYVNESIITGTGWFRIGLTTLTGNGSVSEERIALTNLTYINRNDYLDIPIILTDYKLEIDVVSYPPIGGYPPSVVYNGDAYHITFAGGGPFQLTPRLIQLSDNTEVTMTDSDWTFSYVDDTIPGFFEESPVLKSGEIYGVIKATATGSVLFTLSANITTSAGIQRMISYKIYINQN